MSSATRRRPTYAPASLNTVFHKSNVLLERSYLRSRIFFSLFNTSAPLILSSVGLEVLDKFINNPVWRGRAGGNTGYGPAKQHIFIKFIPILQV